MIFDATLEDPRGLGAVAIGLQCSMVLFAGLLAVLWLSLLALLVSLDSWRGACGNGEGELRISFFLADLGRTANSDMAALGRAWDVSFPFQALANGQPASGIGLKVSSVRDIGVSPGNVT